MAVIKKFDLEFNGRCLPVQIRVNKDGLFRMKYPEEVVRLLGEPTEAVGPTLEAAKKAWSVRLREFSRAMTTKKKVIRYRVQLLAHIWNDERWFRRDDISFGHGIGVLVWADTFEETRVKLSGDKARYTYEKVDNDLPLSIRDQGKFELDRGTWGQHDGWSMDWTPEREAFFCHIAELLEGLVLKLDAISKDSKALAAFAQVATANLLTGEIADLDNADPQGGADR